MVDGVGVASMSRYTSSESTIEASLKTAPAASIAPGRLRQETAIDRLQWPSIIPPRLRKFVICTIEAMIFWP